MVMEHKDSAVLYLVPVANSLNIPHAKNQYYATYKATKSNYGILTFNNSTTNKRITVITWVATTYWTVVHNSALCIITTRTRTWVRTNFIYT